MNKVIDVGTTFFLFLPLFFFFFRNKKTYFSDDVRNNCSNIIGVGYIIV